jgi:hypothetical protein
MSWAVPRAGRRIGRLRGAKIAGSRLLIATSAIRLRGVKAVGVNRVNELFSGSEEGRENADANGGKDAG